MKKIIVILALAVYSFTANAEDGFRLRLGGGVSSQFGGNKSKSIFAYKVGGAYEWAKSYKFSILLGLEFVHKGCQITGGIKYHTVNGDYLQVPFLLIPKIELKNETYLAFKLGVAASIRVASNTSRIYEDCYYVDEYGDYHYEELGRLAVNDDFGGGIIAGVALDMEKWTLGMEYSRGLLSDEYLQVIGAVIEIKF